METSILTSIKKVLSIPESYTAFDPDIIMDINAAFSVLTDLGVGPDAGFVIEDASNTWDDYPVSSIQLSKVKTYIYLKARLIFDPPATSFALDALKEQIAEHEFRLNAKAEAENA